MDPLLITTIAISFLATLIILPMWISRAKSEGMVGKDMQKLNKPEVAEGGGITVLFGIAIGILFYIAVRTFYFNQTNGEITRLFAILCSILIASMVGVIDDLMGWKKGLSKRLRIFIVLFAAIPLMVINAGVSSMSIPFIGSIDFGIWYALILIPLGVIGATTTYNFLAGFNGLEAGQGIIILSALTYVTYITGNAWLSIVSLAMVASLCAFWIFNKYPSKIFPGDVLTYSVGVMIAAIAILGNIEKIAVFFFIPYIIEFFLKLRGKLEIESFGTLKPDGSLEAPHKKVYGLTHVAMKFLKKIKPSGKVYEQEVVLLIHLFQIAVIVAGILIFL
ncbi:glycosyl transferase family 4 [Candidatus Pacearchaeota archaeon]|nr:glycosyl transferase family 4 [Candidatus Pacearchaeota archaeon]